MHSLEYLPLSNYVSQTTKRLRSVVEAEKLLLAWERTVVIFVSFYQSIIGVMRWMVELGQIDIATEVSLLSSYLAYP